MHQKQCIKNGIIVLKKDGGKNMVFYKIEAVRKNINGEIKEMSREERRSLSTDLSEKSENLFQKSGQQNMIFTVVVRERNATFAAVTKESGDINCLLAKYIKLLPFEIESYRIEEVTFTAFNALLVGADRNDYIRDEDEVLDAFEISDLSSRHTGSEFGEAILSSEMTSETAKMVCDDFLFGETLGPEIERIYSIDAAGKPQGHPVHYMLKTDDRDVRKTIYKTLLSALYITGRIKNRRYSFVDYDEQSRFPGATFDTLYRSSEGGAVVIRYTSEEVTDGEFGRRGTDVIAAICEVANKYKNKVLTVICLPRNANKAKEEFLMNWGTTAFIELYEDVVFGERATTYLKNKAKNNKIRSDKKLTAAVKDEAIGYTAAELNRIFDEWYDKKLRNEIYPQYKTAETVKAKIKNSAPKGSAYDKLQELIGLESAKEVMNNALNFYKAQKLFADRGMVAERPSMHMVFTGNPGTAKTTVARLFAQIMKENGLLTNGDMYEVGRADLVGKYVGSTAPLVKSAFKRAKGGVLFIDEAYSLVDDRDGLFGDEAINTIVQEMENNRKDTVVIFAGYPDKMDGFLNKNPGLRSRIAFHIPFDDYSAKELCDIAELIAAEKKLVLSDVAKNKLEGVFESAKEQNDFGNGRFARNIIEKAKMAQANRLIKMDFDSIADKDLITITAEDIETPKTQTQEKVIKIGFYA